MTDAATYWKTLVVGDSSDDVDEVGHPDMGRTWNRWAYKLRFRAVEASIRATHPGRVDRLYEGAVGVGYYLKRWKRLGASEIAGVDLSAQAITSCQLRFPAYDLRVGSLDALDADADWTARRRTFDVVTAIDVLYHIVEDSRAERAVTMLADLVRPGGVLLITEKDYELTAPRRQGPFVVRRPESWYSAILAQHELALVDTRPMFWCMDPPVMDQRRTPSTFVAMLLWWTMRLLVKLWPRNSVPQLALGWLVGLVGYCLDRFALLFFRSTANLRVLIFRRP